jgi:hypothetical protein
MKKIKLNIISKFNQDLKTAVINDSKNPLNKDTKTKLFFGTFLFLFILSKPIYIYYTGYLIRLNKIEDLKKEGKFIISSNN